MCMSPYDAVGPLREYPTVITERAGSVYSGGVVSVSTSPRTGW